MRTLLVIFTVVAAAATAQTQVNRTIAVKPGQRVNMHFDYPELVKVTSWDKNEIVITGEVSINGGESDEAFELNIDNSGEVISIRNEIRNMKNLPQRVTVKI